MLWQKKRQMDEDDNEYSCRLLNPVGQPGRHYVTEEIKDWLAANAIKFRYDWEDPHDIEYVIINPEDRLALKLKFGL